MARAETRVTHTDPDIELPDVRLIPLGKCQEDDYSNRSEAAPHADQAHVAVEDVEKAVLHMVRAAEIPEVEAESEVGDDHAAKAHGIENHGPHGTLASVVSLFRWQPQRNFQSKLILRLHCPQIYSYRVDSLSLVSLCY